MSDRFDPTGYKSYRYYTTMVFVDEKLTQADMRRGCPNFFANGKGQGERRTVYRGHIIVQKRGSTLVYVYDCRTDDTFLIDKGDGKDFTSLAEAKEFIRSKLETPELNPLTMFYSKERMNIPVEAEVMVFRDAEGKLVSIGVPDIKHVGNPDQRQQDKPQDTFLSAVWDAVNQSLKNTVCTPG